MFWILWDCNDALLIQVSCYNSFGELSHYQCYGETRWQMLRKQDGSIKSVSNGFILSLLFFFGISQ